MTKIIGLIRSVYNCKKMSPEEKIRYANELAKIKAEFVKGLNEREFYNLIFPEQQSPGIVDRNELTIWRETDKKESVAYLNIQWYRLEGKIIVVYSTYAMEEYRNKIKPMSLILLNLMKCLIVHPFSSRFGVDEFSIFSYHMLAKTACEYYPHFKKETPPEIQELMIKCCKKFGYPLVIGSPYLIDLSKDSPKTHHKPEQLNRNVWFGRRNEPDIDFYISQTHELNERYKLLGCFPISCWNLFCSVVKFGYNKVLSRFCGEHQYKNTIKGESNGDYQASFATEAKSLLPDISEVSTRKEKLIFKDSELAAGQSGAPMTQQYKGSSFAFPEGNGIEERFRDEEKHQLSKQKKWQCTIL